MNNISKTDRPAGKVGTALFNPFYYIAGGWSLVLGLGIIILTGVVASPGAMHFDGIIDIHAGPALPRWVFVGEGLIDWLVFGGLLYITGRLMSRTGKLRALDVFGTQALARAPLLLCALLVLLPPFQRAIAALNNMRFDEAALALRNLPRLELMTLTGVTIASIFIMIWMVFLMYRAYTVSCGIQGTRAIVSFIVALVVGEIVSKILIFQMLAMAVVPMPEAIAEQAVDALGRGDFAAVVERFDSTMQAAMPEKKMGELWTELVKQNGAFEERLASRSQNVQGYDVVFVNCRFASETLALQLSITPDKKVGGLYIRPRF